MKSDQQGKVTTEESFGLTNTAIFAAKHLSGDTATPDVLARVKCGIRFVPNLDAALTSVQTTVE